MSNLANGWMQTATMAVVESVLLWSVVTIGLYYLVKRLNRRLPAWWSAPIFLTPVLLIFITLTFNTNYATYLRGTHWLIVLLGPATVAFAVPIHEQRHLILRHWPALVIGVLAGSSVAILSSWILASLLGLHGALRLSLLPRSVSTPFAMVVSGEIGGIPELTAIFVILTGVFGASIGETILYWLPLRSFMARGALFGMGAHAVGSAKALEINRDEGAIAGLVMIFAGIVNVLAAPVLAYILQKL